jgi:SAM-dependent methyltransferase
MNNHHHHVPAADPDSPDAMIELLDLDADVLHSYISGAVAWVRGLAADLPQHRILDLGSGTGSATLVLAQQFGDADVLAVDRSADLLARISAKAVDLGLAGRVSTLQADLDGPWPAIDPVDVVWASLSLHHLADPDRVLRDVFAATRPGGLFAVAEMGSQPRFLPDDIGIGRPGLEARCHAAVAELHARELPNLGADWGQRLAQAGFAVVAERTFDVDPGQPLPAATGRYAQAYLRRICGHLDGVIAADDLATLGTLIDGDGPDSVLRRPDLGVYGTRTIWAARRP